MPCSFLSDLSMRFCKLDSIRLQRQLAQNSTETASFHTKKLDEIVALYAVLLSSTFSRANMSLRMAHKFFQGMQQEGAAPKEDGSV